MGKFDIKITCNKCGSNKVIKELEMSQGTGLLVLECLDCNNKYTYVPDDFYEENDNL